MKGIKPTSYLNNMIIYTDPQPAVGGRERWLWLRGRREPPGRSLCAFWEASPGTDAPSLRPPLCTDGLPGRAAGVGVSVSGILRSPVLGPCR